MINNKPTYISLFSSAGVGCYGFKMENFECIATNELIEKRINIQKINEKCKYESGYINEDITKDETKELIFNEIKKWNKLGNDTVDVIIATPPCQGMSVANHKKNKNDYNRNSLVVESIKLIKTIKPKFFVIENVSSFMNTNCQAPDGNKKAIGLVINEELGKTYDFTSRVINFKNYGSNSSRTRTLIIGVYKKLSEYISPIELFPSYENEKTLEDIISFMPNLEWGEFYEKDFYHQFRTYDERMKSWIHGLKEGESSFDNKDIINRPHKILDGKIIENINKNGDKYKRNYWNKVAPCIHTRNDLLASQNTIHPEQDRVFSIRELSLLMTIPKDFKWINKTLETLNSLNESEKKKILKQNEMNIRQSIGESVPTEIFRKIAKNINFFLSKKNLSDKKIKDLIKEKELFSFENLLFFINSNETYSFGTLSRIVELANIKRDKDEAYFTNKIILNKIYDELPIIDKKIIKILEPSVGIGNFLPYIIKKYEDKDEVIIDVFDINKDMIILLKELLKKYNIPSKIKINFFDKDTLLHNFNKKYDICIGNPPFSKAKGNLLIEYQKDIYNNETKNICSYFIEKSIKISDYVVMILPKNILNTLEYKKTRELINNKNIECIIDIGEKGFKEVLIETICLFVNTINKTKKTKIISLTKNEIIIQKQSYITDKNLPYWIIYRNDKFDKILNELNFGIFKVFRDRQINNFNTTKIKDKNVRVLKSKNISNTGEEILDIQNYDIYIKKEIAENFSVYKYLNDDSVYLTPNMTYYPRMCKKPKGVLVNGSIAILTCDINISNEDMLYFSTEEYRNFYQIARNYQTRSLNIDSSSVYFFGVKK